MSSGNDFKWSSSSQSQQEQPLFPDLHIRIRKQLIGSSSMIMSNIPIQETGQGYLTPYEWHECMKVIRSLGKENNNYYNNSDTIIIDCCNTKEYSIGHFDNAIDPQTTTYAQFPQWVEMYCTGKIRCEKASAYIQRTVPNVKQVQHLHVEFITI